MKILGFLLLATSLHSYAAEVLSARLDASQKNILVDVRYGGGCKKHQFSLKLQGCLESYPVQCKAQLIEQIDGGFDPCEAIIFNTAVINLKQSGLTDPYFKNASLAIKGDIGLSGRPSSATVRLP